jgi:hypothetical protein
VVAAGLEGGEDAEVGVGEEPALGLASGGACGADEGAEMLAAGDGSEMFRADACQGGDFVFGEELLSRFDSDHGLYLFFPEPVRRLRCSASLQCNIGKDTKTFTLQAFVLPFNTTLRALPSRVFANGTNGKV